MGPLIPPFWTSGDVSSGFQSQSGQPYLHLSEAYMMYKRSASVTPELNLGKHTKPLGQLQTATVTTLS